jgi:hypothetical protein
MYKTFDFLILILLNFLKNLFVINTTKWRESKRTAESGTGDVLETVKALLPKTR